MGVGKKKLFAKKKKKGKTYIISFGKDINTPYLKCLFTSCSKTSSISLRFSY